jgi:hypothetical protein
MLEAKPFNNFKNSQDYCKKISLLIYSLRDILMFKFFPLFAKK